MEKQLLILEHPPLTDEEILAAVRMEGEDADEEDVRRVLELAEEAAAVARPKAVFGEVAVDGRGADWVSLGGVLVHSEMVRNNLAQVERVHPYVCTCGTEAEAWSLTVNDPLEEFWVDAIKLLLLGKATARLNEAVAEQYYPDGHKAQMNPGSLKEWPLTAQRELFAVIGGVEETVGVRLTDSCLMLPSKSTSGFFFRSEDGFVNCAFCPILTCPNRRAPYQQEMAF